MDIMPFKDAALEEEFLEAFHKAKSQSDVIVALVFLCIGMNMWAVPELATTAFPFSIAQAVALLLTCLPGYSKWRPWAVYGLRIPPAIGMYFLTPRLLTLQKEPKFLQAAWITGFSYSRFKYGMFIALFYAVPLRGFGIICQTILVAFLLHSIEKECHFIQNDLLSYRVFVSQLEQVYELWEQGGVQPSCAHMCGNILSYAMNKKFCLVICKCLLPVTFTAYGKPWMAACVMHRCIVVAIGGYILPLTGLYIWEMRDRWTFARAHGLPISSLKDAILHGMPPILKEIVMNLFVLLTLKLDY